MQLRQKRQSSFNAQKEQQKTPSSSTPNTSTSNDDNSSHTAPPPKKRMTLDVPVPQEKEPGPANKQPINVLLKDLVKIMENCNQFKNEVERLQKHGTHNFVVTNEFAENIKEVSEKTNAMNALMPNSVNIQPIRKRIQLIIKNCPEVFKKDEFRVESTSIELFGFDWFLVATRENGFLTLRLHAIPPDDFNGNYQIDVDYRLSILNAFALADKDLIKERIGRVYTLDENYNGWGFDMAKFEDLLDPAQTFLTPEGDIEIWVDFTIKSSTLDHLT